MTLSDGVTSVKISNQANALFGANWFDSKRLEVFLEEFSNARFCHACAFPRQEKSSLVPHMAVRLTSQLNGGQNVYMTMGDVDFVLQALRDPEYKQENERGQQVTRFPQIVEELIKAKTNLKLYGATEMQAYLTQSFAARAGAKQALVSSGEAPRASHLRVVR